jgi:zinc transport system substrate-binding protein
LSLVCACVIALAPLAHAQGAPAVARLPVVASFYPLFEFAHRVGGERVTVRNLVPAGAAPHDYEPTLRDVRAIHEARVLVYNGGGFEPWVERLLGTLPASAVRVNASEGIPLATAPPGGGRGRSDAHIWLDPILAGRQVGNVLAGMIRADPGGRAVYDANTAAYKRRLAALHDLFARTIAPCRKRVFVVSHAAFGYLASRYGLRQIAISGLEPEAEPAASKMREILGLIRRHDVRVIYYETLINPRVANTIAREAGVRTLVLNPIEGLTDDELRQGKDYVSVMEENLRSLAQGLDCP